MQLSKPERALLSITTREGRVLCVSVSEQGYQAWSPSLAAPPDCAQVVGHQQDQDDAHIASTSEVYESAEALMRAISPSYDCLFCAAVAADLKALEAADEEEEPSYYSTD